MRVSLTPFCALGTIHLENRQPVIAHIHLRDQEFKVRSGMTIRSALLRLNIQPEAVLPTRGGELLTDDEILQEGDEIRLIAVISGGAY
jgi:sulfur carrier protein ThiS